MENINQQQSLPPTQPIQQQPPNIAPTNPPSKSKLKIIIAIFIIAILLIGIGGYFMWSRNSQVISQNSLSKSPQDCGTDFDCFIKAANDCSPAIIKNTEPLGVRLKKFHFEIKEQEAEKCVFYGEIENIEGRAGNNPIGIASTCSIDRNDLVLALQDIKVRHTDTTKKLFECLIRGAQGEQRKGADILAKQIAQADNTQRKSDAYAILNAVGQYMTENKGALPSGITTSTLLIRKTDGADICADLVPKYLAALPVDPQANNGTAIDDCTTLYSTGYTIMKDQVTNKIIVRAPNAEGAIIEVTR